MTVQTEIARQIVRKPAEAGEFSQFFCCIYANQCETEAAARTAGYVPTGMSFRVVLQQTTDVDTVGIYVRPADYDAYNRRRRSRARPSIVLLCAQIACAVIVGLVLGAFVGVLMLIVGWMLTGTLNPFAFGVIFLPSTMLVAWFAIRWFLRRE